MFASYTKRASAQDQFVIRSATLTVLHPAAPNSMIKSLRFRARAVSFAALLFASLGLLTSCSDEPLARATQVPEELLLTPLVGRRNNPFVDDSGTPSDSGAWQGTWILRGHLLALTATHAQPGQNENKAFLFGYSYRAKRFFMLTVIAGGSVPDSVNVSWFTIKDKTWQFMPEEVDVGGKAVERQMVWNEKEPAAKALATPNAQDADWTLPPARTEMSQFAGWQGVWPMHTEEHNSKAEGVLVNGHFESKPLGGGYFLGWFEHNDVTVNAVKKTSDQEVDIWGYSEVMHNYFRVNLITVGNGDRLVPMVASAAMFTPIGENGLLLASPLTSTKIDNKDVPSRYGLFRFADTLYVFEQYLLGGINWTDRPSGKVKWVRITTPTPPAQSHPAK
jgi:hypothetical protein